jgi:DNA-binding transcriptional MerR regulator
MSARAAVPAHYPIRAVARLTGLSIDTLRAWERRYAAVTPLRGERGRMYTDADVARLRMLHAAVAAGHNISQVARLGDAALRRMTSAQPSPAALRAAGSFATLADALQTLDSVRIDHELSRLAATLTPIEFVRDVMLPALRTVGDDWERRRGGIAREHAVSAAVRHVLGAFLRVYSHRAQPADVLLATVAGDRHEIGILAAAMLAASRGMAVAYVGADLPAAEIVEAVKVSQARVLVLGLTLTGRTKATEQELRTIVRSLPPGVEFWSGGAGARSYGAVLGARAIVLSDFDTYLQHLARLGARAA